LYFDADSAVRSPIKYGFDFMRPGFQFEFKYRVNILTREDWTKGNGSLPAVKGLVWVTDGSKMREGTGAICGKKVSASL